MNNEESIPISEARVREIVDETAILTKLSEQKKQKILDEILVHYNDKKKDFNSWLNQEKEIIDDKRNNGKGLTGYEMAVLVMRKISNEIIETLDS